MNHTDLPISRWRRLTLPAACALACVGAFVAAPATTAAAKDAPANPLPAILEGLVVGPAVEFRQVALYPILVPREGPKAASLPLPAASAPAAAFGIADALTTRRTRLAVKNLGDKPVLCHPGDLVRTDGGDVIVHEYEWIAAGKDAELDVVLASREPANEKTRPLPAFLGSIPGPALQWFSLTDPREKETLATMKDLADTIELDTPRRSPAEFATAKKIAARVKEYTTHLSTLPATPGGGRRDLAGYAVIVDGGFAGVEIFGDSASFDLAWPTRVQGIAVEAAIQEADLKLLDTDMVDPTNPDRFLADIKGALLTLYAVEPTTKRVEGFGHTLTFAVHNDLGRAAIANDGRLVHLLVSRDPTARKEPTSEDGPLAPGPISRKARPTAFEKRWLDRRAGREPKLPDSK